MAQRKNESKANGHAGPQDRANGHAPASMERGGVPLHGELAASDDASGAAVARPALVARAGADRQLSGDAASPRANGEMHQAARESKDGSANEIKIPPGEFPLPASPGEFVEEIHRETDLLKSWQKLLKSKDDKIRQRAVEKLTEMRYKGAAALADEPQRISIDMPGPKRD
jgi:hypothetical protein